MSYCRYVNKKVCILSRLFLYLLAIFILMSAANAINNLEVNGTFSVDTKGIAFNDGQHPVMIDFDLITNYPVDRYQLVVYPIPYNTTLIGYDFTAQKNTVLIGVDRGIAKELKNGTKIVKNNAIWIPSIDDKSGDYFAHIQFFSKEQAAFGLDAGVYSRFNISDWGYIDPEKYRLISEKGYPDEEIPVSGWEFRVIDNKVKPPKIFNLTTDEEGHASCGPLEVPGDYIVQEKGSNGWRPIKVEGGQYDPKIGGVIISTERQKNVSVKYYNELIPGNVTVRKVYDYDGNGQIDPSESGIPGWPFTAKGGPLNRDYVFPPTNNEGYTSLSMSSSQDGSAVYEINDNLPGDQWECTNCIGGSFIQTVSINPGQSKELTFVNRLKPAEIQIIKFCDVNHNGKKDDNEGPMVATFMVTGPNGDAKEYKTDPQGFLSIPVLFPMPKILTTVPTRTYQIEELPVPGTRPTTPTKMAIDISPGDRRTMTFGNVPVILIHKFEDCNGNGKMDQGESGIPNWKFRIQEKGQMGTDILTNASGWIEYEANCDRIYVVSEYSEANWKPTTKDVRTVSITGNLEPMLFGNMNRSSAELFKFHDENRNSIFDPEENGLANWTFKILGPGIDPNNPAYVVTDESGHALYRFPELGTYNITELGKNGWISTTGLSKEVNVESCSQTHQVFFGNDRLCQCPDMDDAENSLKNTDIKVSKEINPSVLTPDMIDDCHGTWINYTISLQPGNKIAPNDLVLAINQYSPMGNQRVADSIDGVSEFLDAIEGSNSRVGLFLYNGNESIEIRPNSDYSAVRSKITPDKDGRSPLQFRPTTEESRIATWTYGIVDQFYADSKPGVSKILVLITDSESSVKMPSKSLDANYTVYSIVVGPINTTTYRAMESLARANNGAVFVANNSQELRNALIKLTSVTSSNTLYNVQLIETLPNYMTALEPEGNHPPDSIVKNKDGQKWNTITARWNISSVGDKGWNTSFGARFCWNLSADSHLIDGATRPTSKVIYTRENGTTAEIPLPEGLIRIQNSQKFVRPAASVDKEKVDAPGFTILGSLLAIGTGAILMRKRRG